MNLREQLPLLVLLALYVALMAFLGWVGKRRTRDMVDYYVGGRSMGGFAIGLSFFATYASTNSYLGFSGKAYSHGIAWLLLVPFAVGFSLLAWAVIAPRLRRVTAELDSVTIPDFIGLRFASPTARLLAAIIVLFASFVYLTAVYKGIGNLLEVFLDVPYWSAIGLVLVIVVFYTALGGFHSVVRTDVVQGILMIVAAVLLFFGVVRAAGGVDALSVLAGDSRTAYLFRWDAAMPLPLLLGILFATTVKFLVEPRQLSRFYALSDDRQVRVGIWVSTAAFLIVFSLLAPLGLYAHRLLPAGAVDDTDRIIPELLAGGQVFGGMTRAFLFLAILSAALSSLDSVLLVMASTFRRDLAPVLARLRRRTLSGDDVAATRALVVVFATLTAIIALDPPGGIVELTAFSGALFGASFLPTMLLGLVWHRGSGRAVVASFVVGIGVLALWPRLAWSGIVHPVFPAVLLSFVAYCTGALLDGQSVTEMAGGSGSRVGALAGTRSGAPSSSLSETPTLSASERPDSTPEPMDPR